MSAERKRLEYEYRELERRLYLISDSLPGMLVSYVDTLRRYQFNNKSYEAWYPATYGSGIRGRPMADVRIFDIEYHVYQL